MTGVDKDLATLRDSLTGGHSGRISQGLRALARVEAELARLREQRDALDRERDAGWRTMVEQRERAEAAETRCAELAEQGRIAAKRYGEEVERCARLQQALVDLHESLFIGSEDGLSKDTLREMAAFAKRAALAGPDTPTLPYVFDKSLRRWGLFLGDLPNADWIEYVRHLESLAVPDTPAEGEA